MTSTTTEVKVADKICISEAEYSAFKQEYGKNGYPGKRFGQAFCEHFKLGEMVQENRFDNLYNLEDLHGCIKFIRANFIFT